jgi:hypothetical protein
MEFVVIARYRARPGAEGRVEAGLRNMLGPTRAAFRAHLDTGHFATWLKGQVLPNLDERTRFDLVPLGPDVREPKA